MEIDNNQIQLLDVIGIPTNNLIFSSLNDTLVYNIGSNIIYYNLQKNTKTFLQYNTTNEISTFTYLDTKELILLSIDKSSKPLLNIWELPLFEEIFTQEIQINSDFNISNIFIEKISSNLFVIIITSIDSNLLYILKHEKFFNFNIIKIGQIPNLPIEIEGFKCFYDDVFLIFMMNNYLQYYLIDIQNIFNNKNEVIKLYKKIVFPFKLMGNISISNKYSLVSLITSKGNCLLYNKKGDSVQSINPLDNDEYFTINHISGESLCLGTNSSKIYIYNLNDYKLKYFIKDTVLNNIKLNFQLNNGSSNKKIKNNYNKNKNIEFINLNEKLDKIFIKMNDNSILLAPLTSLMDDSRGLFNFNSLGNTVCLYSYNHSRPINYIEICNNYNEYETIIYTCSKDQTIIQYNINYSTNKLSNLYFNLYDILNNHNILNDNNYLDNNNYDNNNNIYLTIIKFHPFHNTKLFAGDNNGYLYIFDISYEYFQYKKYTIDNYSIESLSFSREGNLLCIGLITGKQAIYDINKNFEFCLKLSENYLSQDEIDLRIKNYHIITFSYFFKSQKHRDCILFSKNNQNLEYSQLFYDEDNNGLLNKKTIIINEFENIILDVKVHISENYLIALNNKHQIIINDINLGETTAVIDLNGHVREIYNFEIDRSGLYLAVICSLNNKSNNDKNNDIIFFEVGTGNIVSYIKCIGMIYKIIFDYYGKFIIMAGNKGDLSLWKLSTEMSNIIINVLYEIEKNNDFWEQFEIKYYSNNNKNNYENLITVDNQQIFRTEINKNTPKEVFDYGPHKGIQTSGYNDINNLGNKMINPTNKILNDLYINAKDDNYNINNNDIKNNNDNYEIKKNDINKSIPMKNNIYNSFNSSKMINDENDNINYFYNSGNNDINNKDKNNKDINNKEINNKDINNKDIINKYSSFINIENNKRQNNISYSNSKIMNNHIDNLNNNLKNENSLQNCYEKFKKERLMKNSLLKPNNNKLNKIKEKNKNFSNNNLNNNYKSNKKINSLSSPKISTSTKYLKNSSQNNNNINNNIFSKEKFNKKEIDDIDINIDVNLNINKIRPNFDPNLYSQQTNKKYIQTIKELIQPFISYDYERKFSRYNNIENGNQKINNQFNSYNNFKENNFINKNFDNNFNNKSNKSIINSSKNSIDNEKKNEINNAINILMENKIKNDNNDGDNYNNNYFIKKSISSKDISQDVAYINNNQIKENNIDNYNNNYKDNKNIQYSININENKINSNNNQNINNLKLNNNINNKNALMIGENRYKETLSTEKRNYLQEKINNFERKLKYYGQ